MKHNFPMMTDLIPEMSRDGVIIRHREVSEDEIQMEQMREMFSGARTRYHIGMEPGTYLHLSIKGQGLVMSDTWMERSSNQDIIEKANGSVLIAGLGIGMVLTLLAKKPEVNRVVVLENNQTLIDLIGPYYESPPVEIVFANAFTWEPIEKFDTIYFDIWPDITGDHYEETKILHKKYRRHLTKGGYINSWMRDEFKRLNRIGW